ncbi:TPA: hypothetical protein ACH3X3_013979 [Trebouxia sp. C0006]
MVTTSKVAQARKAHDSDTVDAASGTIRTGSTAEKCPRAQGKEFMRSGRCQEAISHYSTEINDAKREADDLQQLCPHLELLYCNRALAHLKLRQFFPAMLDAKLALEQDPKLLKAHHRLAQAQLGLESFKAAMQSAQAGQHLLDIKADRTTDFTILMDQIAMAGALKADYAGFDGRILQVNSLQPSLLP